MSEKQNGSVPYDKIPYTPLDTVIQIEKVTGSYAFQTFLQVIKSAIPYLIFLAMYGLNTRLHILATPQDLDRIHLYNISYFEYSILHLHPHKFISSHSHQVLDFLAAVPYLMHYILPVVFPLYLLCKRKPEDICKFYWLLGWFLWVQYLIWFMFPTAPPWFYENMKEYSQTGVVPSLKDQHKEGCAFHRVDTYTGNKFFFTMFGNNPAPYGAFPSGHVAWPTAICVINPPLGSFCWLYVLYVSWATLYSCHHYLSDALAAVILVFLVRKVLLIIKEKQLKPGGCLQKSRELICIVSVD